MLISGNTIVVVGYSYGRGGTEINLFDIGEQGSLAYRSTYHLRSNDYYSSRNYASRLIGTKLVFYTPRNTSVTRKIPFSSSRHFASGTRAPRMTNFAPSFRRHASITPRFQTIGFRRLRCIR